MSIDSLFSYFGYCKLAVMNIGVHNTNGFIYKTEIDPKT